MKLLSALLFAYSCSAQTVGGQLQGTVTDPSGSAVVRAAIETLHVETADLRRLVTDDEGRWQDPVVKPDVNPILGGPNRYWDINAFTLQPANRRGNLGRNTLIGPGIRDLDVSESARVDFRAEVSNLPNHANSAAPSGVTAFTGVAANGTPTVAANWGVITTTVNPSRQVQFALKVVF